MEPTPRPSRSVGRISAEEASQRILHPLGPDLVVKNRKMSFSVQSRTLPYNGYQEREMSIVCSRDKDLYVAIVANVSTIVLSNQPLNPL
ncbi:hypothetical protein RRG08_035379 [Elysia crispata]|uniref:Uncharacterized protein n=1 Tax=Elysia crispata TaxID=231223 RepID=A0AAE1CRY1_9GAST|nr:hypothetical protein RRG08_035379 [Elysia crispata]